MSQTPTKGRIVTYCLSAQDADQINRRRADASRNAQSHPADGTQVHVGNPVIEGEEVAAVITAVHHNTLVNLKCLLDGNDDYWRPSTESEVPTEESPLSPGRWCWPARVG